MNTSQLSRVLATRRLLVGSRLAVRAGNDEPIPRNYESTRVQDARRFEDEAEPGEDDQIKSHYLKHHPFYEFKNFDELQVDGYRHWLHGRVDYFQSETYPGEMSAWEMGSKLIQF